MKKIWEIKNNIKYQKLKIDEVIEALLKNRGLISKKQVDEFLKPSDPYILDIVSVGIKKREITKAIKRIKKAIDNKENIVVYGDYDADGICATAIMWETLHALKVKVMPFIPDREKHGYGLKKEGIEDILNNQQLATPDGGQAINNQPFLIITVDNGIVSHKAIDYCNKKGIDVIVTDHHQKKAKSPSFAKASHFAKATRDRSAGRQKLKVKKNYDLPKAYSIIWSDKISGAGVAWLFAREIYQYFKKSLLGFKASNTLELACIGTICDLTPLLGVNRSIVKFGLQELQQTKRQGMLALIADAGVDQQNLATYEIGYIIGPRLNAMGRLADALDSLRLLCTKNKKRASNLAEKLGLTNRERQQLTQKTFEHAKNKVKLKAKNSKLLFIGHESYSQGVIGLVAGKLVEEFYRPAIVISKDSEYSKGSARSIKGFDIIRVLREVGGFEDFGGHPMAAGFTIKTSNLEKVQKSLEKYAVSRLSDDDLRPKITADCQIDLSDISWEFYDKLEKFSPFGLGNPTPVFVSKDVEIVDVRQVGREGRHLKLKLKKLPATSNQQPVFDAIGFGLGNLAGKISPGDRIGICYCLEKNVWNGEESLQLKVKDIKKQLN